MTIYQIKPTNGGTPITIQPGQLNGPSGTSNVTDLDLYGQGTLNWGKGVDQNQYRLLENFACPQHPTEMPPRPVKMHEATDDYQGDGESTGINKPVKGQLWFNTTNSNTVDMVLDYKKLLYSSLFSHLSVHHKLSNYLIT